MNFFEIILSVLIVVGIYTAVWLWAMPKPTKREAKETDDLLWSAHNSTKWEDQRCCGHCGASLGVTEGCCPNCSEVSIPIHRAHRKIWRGYGWAHQYRYRDGRMELTREPL